MNILHIKSPLTVELTLTECCNHKCLHCYNPWRSNNMQNSTLSFSQIDKIIKELVECEVQFVIITGGEPLSRQEELIYTINALKKANIKYCINSNITLLTPTLLKKLHELDVKSILTSLPSIYESKYEDITQIKGSYKKFMQNLDLCNNYNFDITVNIVISKMNIDELDNLIPFVKTKNIKGISMSLVIPPSYDINNANYQLENKDILRIADTLLDIKKSLGIYVNSLTPLPLCILKNVNKYESIISATCSAGITVCTIGADGTVNACAHDNTSYGNILSDGLKACWDKMEDRRNIQYLNPICTDCKFIGICGGECRMITKVPHKNNYYINNKADIKFEFASVPKLDLETTYIVNQNVLVREESFGAAIIIDFKNFFVSKNIVRLINILLQKKIFKLKELSEDVEINENFYSNIYYMEKISLIKKLLS